jgi:uncharacterized membrane protein (UPF0127 family)
MIRGMSMSGSLRFLTLLLTIAAACTSCAAGNPYVELKGHRFQVEIADDREEQALGLMFRTQLPDDKGMLFIFPNEAPRSFWMLNTRIPLDIIYFNRALEMINVQTAKPCRTDVCPGYPSARPAMYVLELNAGKAAELGLLPGDEMVLHLD